VKRSLFQLTSRKMQKEDKSSSATRRKQVTAELIGFRSSFTIGVNENEPVDVRACTAQKITCYTAGGGMNRGVVP
jgi:hypothetical protein